MEKIGKNANYPPTEHSTYRTCRSQYRTTNLELYCVSYFKVSSMLNNVRYKKPSQINGIKVIQFASQRSH